MHELYPSAYDTFNHLSYSYQPGSLLYPPLHHPFEPDPLLLHLRAVHHYRRAPATTGYPLVLDEALGRLEL